MKDLKKILVQFKLLERVFITRIEGTNKMYRKKYEHKEISINIFQTDISLVLVYALYFYVYFP